MTTAAALVAGFDRFAAMAETHSAVVVFLGDRAYKLKKPVCLGFLDFSTLEQRESACHREVELNRRFAPDVYLGVADLMGPDGLAWEHLVAMRRMPEETRLSTLVTRGAPVGEHLRHIAHAVATIHAAAPTSAAIAAAGTRDAVRANWEQNFSQLQPFVGSILDPAIARQVEELASSYLEGRGPLFDRRIAEGRVRDGHGDLLADDIYCLDDGPRILDCIEFDDRLRYGDVLADAAFLAMDLERLGAPELADLFLRWWRELSAETYPATLGEHYIAYRAHVRAKVACLRWAQGDDDAPGAARQLLALALSHLERARPQLVLVGGLPGTGKSMLATSLAEDEGWCLLRSDEVRKDLVGMGHGEHAPAPFQEGLYRPEITEETYDELLRRARHALGMGEPVVLDATWTQSRWREEAAAVARETTSELVELHCVAPADVAAARVRMRMAGAGDVSDATAEVVMAMAGRADPWPSASVVETTGEPESALMMARAALERWAPPRNEGGGP